ncbi:MAG: LD-carboxypeptidase [Burkholderiales bacterium]|nr:LD-carboxypeptidase [Burkholderiales bacterium]
MSIVAPPVVPGDTVAVVTPATPFDMEIFAAGVRALETLGFKVKVDPEVHLAFRYTSGSAEQRAGVFQRALADPEVKALIAARGGFGSIHTLPHLDLSGFAANPKRIVGCSDLTTLLHYVWQETQVVTYHGPMVAGDLGRGMDAASEADFMATLAGRSSAAKFIPLEVLHPGAAEGTLTGGCLSLLSASMGTPYEFEPADGLLFVEDIREHPYKVDRMLTQLLLGGKLDAVRGIVFGQMTGCEAPQGADYKLQDVLRDLLRPLGVPVYFGFPSGHSTPHFTLPIGAQARMADGRLSILGGGF